MSLGTWPDLRCLCPIYYHLPLEVIGLVVLGSDRDHSFDFFSIQLLFEWKDDKTHHKMIYSYDTTKNQTLELLHETMALSTGSYAFRIDDEHVGFFRTEGAFDYFLGLIQLEK